MAIIMLPPSGSENNRPQMLKCKTISDIAVLHDRIANTALHFL